MRILLLRAITIAPDVGSSDGVLTHPATKLIAQHEVWFSMRSMPKWALPSCPDHLFKILIGCDNDAARQSPLVK